MFQEDEEANYLIFLKNEKIDRANDALIERKLGLLFGAPAGMIGEECYIAIPEYQDMRDSIRANRFEEEKSRAIETGTYVAEDWVQDVEVDDPWELYNSWECNDPKRSYGRLKVCIFKHRDTGEKMHQVKALTSGSIQSRYLLENTLDRSIRYHDHTAEKKANRNLRKQLRPAQIRQLDLTGCFAEGKTKSGLLYVLRKGKPTLAYRRQVKPKKGLCFVAALCTHPLAYYGKSFAGFMVPSDELLAHLAFIRADEYTFWKKANHHNSFDELSGF